MEENIKHKQHNIFSKALRLLFSFLMVLLLMLSWPGFSGLHAGANPDHRKWAEFIDSLMQELVSSRDLPNASVSLVAEGEIVFMKGYGYADLDTGKAADPKTSLFRTGSVAKIFTWTAVMQLVEQGLIDPDRDVNEYIDFELPRRIHGKGRRYQPAPVTMRHLMSHTAGFEDVLEALFLLEPADALTLREYLVRHMPARIFPAGTVMAYSNYGTALAGYIVERLSGLPFGEYIEKNIFAPLGMEHSSFSQPLPPELQDKLVGAYRMVEGEFKEGGFEIMPGPAGGLSTTAEDMARFMTAHLTGGVNILKEETVRQMHSLLYTHHTLLGGMAHGLMEYTLNGRRVVFHPGSSTLFDAGFYLLPESGTGLFIVYSGGNFTGPPELFNAFMQEFFPGKEKKHLVNGREAIPGTTPPAPAAPSLDRLKGEYQQSRRVETGEEKVLNLISGVLRVGLYSEDELDVDLLLTRSAEELMKEDPENGLVIDLTGSGYRFTEVQAGIFKNLDGPADYPMGPLQYLVATTDPFGRLMLATDGPVTYIRMPFYATAGFAALITGFSVFIAFGTLIFYAVTGMVIIFRRKAGEKDDAQVDRRAQKMADPASGRKVYKKADAAGKKGGSWRAKSRTAKRVILLHAILVLLMLWSVAVTGRPDPVYQLPMAALGRTSFLTLLPGVLPLVLALLSVPVIICCVIAWKNRWWKISGRIHYSLYMLAAVSLTWIFRFYNLLW